MPNTSTKGCLNVILHDDVYFLIARIQINPCKISCTLFLMELFSNLAYLQKLVLNHAHSEHKIVHIMTQIYCLCSTKELVKPMDK